MTHSAYGPVTLLGRKADSTLTRLSCRYLWNVGLLLYRDAACASVWSGKSCLHISCLINTVVTLLLVLSFLSSIEDLGIHVDFDGSRSESWKAKMADEKKKKMIIFYFFFRAGCFFWGLEASPEALALWKKSLQFLAKQFWDLKKKKI